MPATIAPRARPTVKPTAQAELGEPPPTGVPDSSVADTPGRSDAAPRPLGRTIVTVSTSYLGLLSLILWMQAVTGGWG